MDMPQKDEQPQVDVREAGFPGSVSNPRRVRL